MDAETAALDRKILRFIRLHADRPAREEAFDALAQEIFRYQFKRNTHYRRFCEMEGCSPENISCWKDIPAMPVAGFKELVLAAFGLHRRVKTFKTSGTTAGSRGAHFFDTLQLYETAIIPSFKKYLLPDGARCRFFFLMEHPQSAPQSSLCHMMGVVNRRFSKPVGKFYVKEGKLLPEKLFKDLKSHRGSAMILATAFSLKAFLDFLKVKRVRLSLPAGSRLMETGGFKGRTKAVSQKKLYAECAIRLGLDMRHCVSEYGMTELSSQCYDSTLADHVAGRRREPVKETPAWLRAVLIDPRSKKEARKGVAGMIRFYDLANRGSVMAVQTEDLGRAVTGGFRLIGRASGAPLRGCSLSYERFLRTAP